MSPSIASLTRIGSAISAACLAVGTTLLAAPSATASPRVEPCIWPDTGTNLQTYFDVSVSLVIPPADCGQVRTGSPWATPVVFYVARTWEQVPPGYQPVGATPLDELEADLVSVRLIVDEGTPQEFTVERSGPQIHVQTAAWDEVYPDDPDWLLVDIGTHITMRPLPPGTHTVSGEFVLDAPACDGTSADYDQSCIPAGVFAYPSTRTFTVVPRG
jgi:hypothetical protein